MWDEQGKMGVDHDWSRRPGHNEGGIQWAFIALGCWHEVQEVYEGHRLTLVYSLQGTNAHRIADDYFQRWALSDAVLMSLQRSAAVPFFDLFLLPNAKCLPLP